MRMVLVLVLVVTTGCSSLILREDDTTAERTGKVVTRVILAPATLLFSELGIHWAKNHEAWEAQLAEEARYYAALCEKDGFARGTAEHHGCVSAKMDAAHPPVVRSGSQRLSTSCYRMGQWVNCF